MLRSVHKTQAQRSQISWRNDLRALLTPVEWTNWTKWPNKTLESTPIKPIQSRTRGHNEANEGQDNNKCCVDSIEPQPETHTATSEEMTPLVTRLDLVGNLSRSSLQAEADTFRGTCLCQIIFAAKFARGESFEVKTWYAPRTE